MSSIEICKDIWILLLAISLQR